MWMAIAPAPEPLGSKSRLAEIYTQHSRSLWAYLYRVFCRADPDYALDLMQEVFLKVLGSHGSVELPETDEHARNWLYRLAHQVAIDEHRKGKAGRRDGGSMVSLDDP